MIREPFARYKNPAILFIIYCVFLLGLAIWQQKSRVFFNYDSLRHYLCSLDIFEQFQNGLDGFVSRIKPCLFKHPPGVYLLTGLFYFFVESTQNNSVIINTAISIAVILFSMYQLAKTMKQGSSGVLAAFIFLSYPVIFDQAKVFMLDLPLTGAVILNIYLLIRAEYFTDRKYSLLYVFSFLAGLLIKINFLLFTAMPLVYAVYVSLKQKKTRFFSVAVWVSLIASVIALHFFVPTAYMKYFFKWPMEATSAGIVVTWTPEQLLKAPFFIHKLRALLWYLWGFINWQAGFVYFTVFLCGLVVFLRSKVLHKRMVFFCLVSSYLLLSCFIYAIDFDMEVTGLRYSMPVLPIVALISAYGIMQIKKWKIRFFAIGAIIFYGVVNCLVISFPLLKKDFSVKADLKQDAYHLLPGHVTFFSTEPLIISGSNWVSRVQDRSGIYNEIEEIFFLLARLKPEGRIKVLLLSDNPDWWHLKYLAHRHGKEIEFYCDYSGLVYNLYYSSPCDLVEASDYLIDLKNGFTEPYLRQFQKQLGACFKSLQGSFTLIYEDEYCKIYERHR